MTLGDDEDPSLAQHPPRTVDVGDVIRDRFVLEAELGTGGMGRVFKALDLRRLEAHDRHPHVAIKLLTHAFRQHPASFVALQREARRAQTLAHPNIISVFDFDREGSLVYLIMEYLHGRTLNDTLAQPDFCGMGYENAMRIIEPIGHALAFAHGHGIVHSDLKPSNIFLTDDGRVKVIDFGIARAFRLPDAADGDATLFDASSLRAFSPLYASPELIDGDEADPRDDIFSLACITYELISGRHPFGRRSAVAARAANQEAEKLPNLSRGQWTAIRRGLCFSRGDRTASIDGFMTGLASHASGKARLRPLGAKAAGRLGSFFGHLDPRPAAKALWLLTTGLSAALRGFAGRLDPRPVARRLWLRMRETPAAIVPLMLRLKPQLAGKSLRLPAALVAAVLLIGGLAWLVQPGLLTAPASTDPGSAVSAPAGTPGADATPAAPEPKMEQPGPAAVSGAAPAQETAGPSDAAGLAVVLAADQGPSQSPVHDCPQCPEMVVIPAGTLVMGAPPSDADAEREERPQRQVAFERPFAIGRFEVTERQWTACASDGFCRSDRPGGSFAPPDLPKTHVDWQDAQAFIGWLNGKTAGGYRLPTEAEWEYAARGGTATRYPWGDAIGENNANCRDCGAPMGGQEAAPVGSFAANGFGVFDMTGNVWEWTADCASASRRNADRGAAPSCSRRVLRGGSWANSAKAVRVTQRLSANPTLRENIVGFRVARDVP